MRPRVLFYVLAATLLTAMWVLVAHAQTGPEAKVIHTVPENKADSLELRMLFTIFDANGLPVPRNDIQVDAKGKVQLLTSSSAPVDATIEYAKTPLKLALVLDSSGSMAPYISEVKAAAIKFVNEAPEDAQLAVFDFSEDLRLIQDFTDKSKIGLIENAIQRISTRQPGTGDTCLHKAAFDAIKALEGATRENPEDRRALVLFTDGKDREAGGQNCGEMQAPNVITQARLSGRIPIQVHTIGLCKDNQCSNVDTATLKHLAASTFAFTASGKTEELDSVFQTILSGLDSQWVARANVLAIAGENQANLAFGATIRGNAEKFNLTTDSFTSLKDYTLPTPKIELTGRRLALEEDVYTLTLRVTNPQVVGEITVEAWDSDAASVVSQVTYGRAHIKPEMTITQKTEGFKVGVEYCSQVKAKTTDAVPIKNEKGDETLVSLCGKYERKEKDLLSFAIKSADINWTSGALEIRLDNVKRPSEKSLIYRGNVNEGSRLVQDITNHFLEGDLIPVPLPAEELEKVQKAGGQMEYTIVLSMREDGAAEGPTVTYNAKPSLPVRVGLLEGIWLTLMTPWVLISIVSIILTVFALLIFLRFQTRKRDTPPAKLQPPPGGTIMAAGAGAHGAVRAPVGPPPVSPPDRKPQSSHVGFAPLVRPGGPGHPAPDLYANNSAPPVRARIKVVKTPGEARPRVEIVQRFPCVLGRGEEANFVIAHDKTLSRKHAEIRLEGSRLKIIDCNSPNGTFVGNVRLEPGTSRDLGRHNAVKLGRNTELEIEVEVSGPADDLRTQYGHGEE